MSHSLGREVRNPSPSKGRRRPRRTSEPRSSVAAYRNQATPTAPTPTGIPPAAPAPVFPASIPHPPSPRYASRHVFLVLIIPQDGPDLPPPDRHPAPQGLGDGDVRLPLRLRPQPTLPRPHLLRGPRQLPRRWRLVAAHRPVFRDQGQPHQVGPV